MIKAVGGWSGFQVGMQPYETYLKEVKATPGLYRKAAVLLQNIAMGRMFKDGQHRTAFVVTKDFLEHNGGEFKEKDEVKLIRFIKDIRKFSIDEITSWLEYGSTKPPE
jgi:prophage maintenance system killer protein